MIRYCCDSLSSISSVGTITCSDYLISYTSSNAASSVGLRGCCRGCERPFACSHTSFSLIRRLGLDFDRTSGAEEEGGAEDAGAEDNCEAVGGGAW